MELGGDFTFVGRQKRLRIGSESYRIDLLFFHRRLRCVIVIDLKVGKFTHADAGQMHLYLNYAREHWTLPDENPPVIASATAPSAGPTIDRVRANTEEKIEETTRLYSSTEDPKPASVPQPKHSRKTA